MRVSKLKTVKAKLASGEIKEYTYASNVKTGVVKPIASKPGTYAHKKEVAGVADVTVEQVIRSYHQSDTFEKLALATKRSYEADMVFLMDHVGNKLLKDLKRPQIFELLDILGNRKGRKSNVVKMLSILFSYAVDRAWVDYNFARGIKKPEQTPRKKWPVEKFDEWTRSMNPFCYTACMLGRYTGQRLSDCLNMKWEHYDGEFIYVSQKKTKMENDDFTMVIPVVPELKKFLDRMKQISVGEYIVNIDRDGDERRIVNNVSAAVSNHLKKVGASGYTFHGLRATAASELAESGCSVHEIMAITGHKSVGLVGRYTRETNQRKNALAAMKKLSSAAE